jgi:ribosomal protein S18 acetylase RimI-like enzyme
MIQIRPASEVDHKSVLAIVTRVLRAGETYAVPTDLTDSEAFAYWFDQRHEVFVADDAGAIVGTYYLMANQGGNGAHVANCGYMTAQEAQGKGVARAMCTHSLARARDRGFRAMQFNHVVSTNARAIALWQSLGFSIVGTLPGAFRHPVEGYVDSYVMFRAL